LVDRLRQTSRWAKWAVVLPLLALGVGCAAPQGPALHDDIVSIYQFFRPDPWLKDEEGRIAGLKGLVYFVAAGLDKGVFVSGTIKASLYARNPRPDGTYERSLAYEWAFDEKQAEGFRIVKPSIMGQAYGFVLRWQGDLQLAGREVELRFSYICADGRVVTGRATSLRVEPLYTPERRERGAPTSAPAPRKLEPTTRPPPRPGGD
jgi:hypothetical protein